MRELYSANISIDSDRVLLVKFKNDVSVEIDEMKKLVEVSLELVADEPFYLLVDARDILGSMDHESRKYVAEHERYNELNIAQAILVNNMPIRLLASAYYSLYKHMNPVKIFSDIDKAKEWLFKQH